MEVLYIDVFVRSRFALAPQQQTLFGCHFLNGNVLDGKSQDDCPNHTESHLKVSVDDFFSTNRHEFDAFWCNEIQSFVDVGDLSKEIAHRSSNWPWTTIDEWIYLVETHFSTIWLWEGFSRNDFEQEHEFESIAKIVFNTLDCCSGFAQMTVTPGSESLQSKLIKANQQVPLTNHQAIEISMKWNNFVLVWYHFTEH